MASIIAPVTPAKREAARDRFRQRCKTTSARPIGSISALALMPLGTSSANQSTDPVLRVADRARKRCMCWAGDEYIKVKLPSPWKPLNHDFMAGYSGGAVNSVLKILRIYDSVHSPLMPQGAAIKRMLIKMNCKISPETGRVRDPTFVTSSASVSQRPVIRAAKAMKAATPIWRGRFYRVFQSAGNRS